MPIFISSPQINATPIAAGTTQNTVIKSSPGTFYGVLVTSVGVGAPIVYDNNSTAAGTIVGILGPSAALGLSDNINLGIDCLKGIVVSGGATNPGMTVFWS